MDFISKIQIQQKLILAACLHHIPINYYHYNHYATNAAQS